MFIGETSSGCFGSWKIAVAEVSRLGEKGGRHALNGMFRWLELGRQQLVKLNKSKKYLRRKREKKTEVIASSSTHFAYDPISPLLLNSQ